MDRSLKDAPRSARERAAGTTATAGGPPDLLGQFPVVLRIPVQWGEMDAYGHVNNTVFFRYFESARVEFLARCGFLASYEQHRIGAILHSTACRFRRPLFYPDAAWVGGRATKIEADRFHMEYRVVSEAQDAVVADGTGIIVSYDYAGETKVPLPDSVRDGIRALMLA